MQSSCVSLSKEKQGAMAIEVSEQPRTHMA
jgi:hypothetical protein